MRLRTNKGYIRGVLNLVDKHDQFDTQITMISLTPGCAVMVNIPDWQ